MLARTGAAVARNVRQKMGGLRLLRSLDDGCARVAFCDPQYRTVLDKLNYGNEGARQKGRAALPQMTERTIALFVQEIERVLAPSGYLMLWTDKFGLAEGRHRALLRYAPRLRQVDLIHWNKMRIGMGKRARCQSEYLLVLQKEPIIAAATWRDRGIRDTWSEMSDRDLHPHAKPAALIERLIRATTKPRDLVVDPCAGGYGVLEVCRLANRDFIGCDIA